ncbi:hypothetical protein [Aeromonas enteropelogenes]|uniref:hypothetical protein n=1 Tax=Aeromonas enteropelogenes TaxID=29489 RepID=UPI0009E419FC|nr:hypothetical protein [Aeromonas enteropelogenes]UBH52805.1 hypothetical protein LA321_02660 [Aeromonas enteropelogenes]
MNIDGCPVCGYFEFTALDSFGCTTFEICQCCGYESGLDYQSDASYEHLLKLRRDWLLTVPQLWWGREVDKPKNFNPIVQLKLSKLINTLTDDEIEKIRT